MKTERTCAVLVHSGGPTAVINASLLGVVEEAQRRQSAFDSLLGAQFGMEGLLNERFIDLLKQRPDTLRAVAASPASALGTSRREIVSSDFDRLLGVCRIRNVRVLFYTGGNGSMETARQIQLAADRESFELQVIGIPKTIDNDLLVTDHSPGFGSAARFFACALRDIGLDNRALPGQVEIVEVLGRNAGWIVAATALARSRPDDAPHLIYLPEQPLSLEKLCSEAEAVFRQRHRCVIAICEGQLDENGEPFGADVRSGSRGSLAMNLGHRLALLIAKQTGIRTRSEKPGLLGRSCALTISGNDWKEARLCGGAAVAAAAAGERGKMVTLQRENGPEYRITTGLVDLDRVALQERLVPEDWRGDPQAGPAPPLLDYVRPIIGEVEHFAALEGSR